MSRWLIILTALLVAACSPTPQEGGSGFAVVHEAFWGANHQTPYPFTVGGEISCSIHPEFGPEIYFEPTGYIDESSIGTPLNKAAAESLKQAGMTPNVPYSIKKGADLNEAREMGLKECDKRMYRLEIEK